MRWHETETRCADHLMLNVAEMINVWTDVRRESVRLAPAPLMSPCLSHRSWRRARSLVSGQYQHHGSGGEGRVCRSGSRWCQWFSDSVETRDNMYRGDNTDNTDITDHIVNILIL